MMTPQYSRSAINRVGNVLADDSSSAEAMDAALQTLSDWRALHLRPMRTFQSVLRRYAYASDPKAIVAQRLKRTSTIIDKLKNRHQSMDLGRMHDVGGLRAIVRTVQNVREIENQFVRSRVKHILKRTYDYIAEPKESGYRGIHLVYEYQNPNRIDCDGLLIEIQLRTRLQHLWATAVETAGFFFRSSLKSSQGNAQQLEFFQLVSALFAHVEGQLASVPLRQFSRGMLIDKLQRFEKENGTLALLSGIQSVRSAKVPTPPDIGCWLISTAIDPPEVKIFPFLTSQWAIANFVYGVTEGTAECKSGKKKIVLVFADSVRKLEKAYPSFFLDIADFVKKVRMLIDR